MKPRKRYIYQSTELERLGRRKMIIITMHAESRKSLLSDNIQMGQMLAVHDEKLDKQDRIDAVLFEKIKQVDEKLDKHANDIKKDVKEIIS